MSFDMTEETKLGCQQQPYKKQDCWQYLVSLHSELPGLLCHFYTSALQQMTMTLQSMCTFILSDTRHWNTLMFYICGDLTQQSLNIHFKYDMMKSSVLSVFLWLVSDWFFFYFPFCMDILWLSLLHWMFKWCCCVKWPESVSSGMAWIKATYMQTCIITANIQALSVSDKMPCLEMSWNR